MSATSSLAKMSGYRVLVNKSSSTSSWALVNVVRSRRCLRWFMPETIIFFFYILNLISQNNARIQAQNTKQKKKVSFGAAAAAAGNMAYTRASESLFEEANHAKRSKERERALRGADSVIFKQRVLSLSRSLVPLRASPRMPSSRAWLVSGPT